MMALVREKSKHIFGFFETKTRHKNRMCDRASSHKCIMYINMLDFLMRLGQNNTNKQKTSWNLLESRSNVLLFLKVFLFCRCVCDLMVTGLCDVAGPFSSNHACIGALGTEHVRQE